MTQETPMQDREARCKAETTFDRNVVVVAGAGTGKTTLLVNRLVHLLMKEPRPLPITETVALTYTNKAATEMKIRLRERLTLLARSSSRQDERVDGGQVSVEDLETRYGITADDVAQRAAAALADLEKAQIGTLHSFAAHLLRLYPLEAQVDPAFREDDGLRFQECFRTAWDLWIDRELAKEGTQHRLWRMVLESTTLEQIRELAWALSSDLVDTDILCRQVRAEPNKAVLDWVGDLGTSGRKLLQAYDRPKRRKIEQMLDAAVALIDLIQAKGAQATEDLKPSAREWLEKDTGDGLSDWDPSDFAEAARLVKLAQRFLLFKPSFFMNLLTVLSPFVASVKTSFDNTGWISFDGLLARARRLLWAHPGVRERIKTEYRAILIDEFQDTDPMQYEILLALGEQPGCSASTWQDMTLEPGKLFIVGDPKQSIYAFRRADMEAFDRVVDKVLADGGALYSLTTNFRSDVKVLESVNDLFDRLFVRQALVQPANVRLEADGRRGSHTGETGVILRVIAPRSDEEPFDAAAAARAEAEALAQWLSEDLLRREGLRPGHVAFLFRKLTQADAYLDALRRYDIPYLIEGEKHFYRRQEVIDLMNVLRVLDHPHDHIALLGVLRSPLGGLTDREVYDLRESGGFNYLNDSVHASSESPMATACHLYRRLAVLHRRIAAVPLDEAVQLVFDELPILELAAASLYGEQAVANLLKVKQTAASLTDRPWLTLSGFIELMVGRLEEQPEEAESPLAEDASDAVQILTIHKAKGLEFPIVVLPGLHQGSAHENRLTPVLYDWSTGTYGVAAGPYQTLGYARVQEKLAEREKAERRRILYVGMTRAKDMVVLSAGITPRSGGETMLKWLQDIGEGEIGSLDSDTLDIGGSRLLHRVVHAPERKRRARVPPMNEAEPAVDPASLARIWHERTARWQSVRARTWHVTPTSLHQNSPVERAESVGGGSSPRTISRLVGIVAHRVLEDWDFGSPPTELLRRIGPALDRWLSSQTEPCHPEALEALTEMFTTFGASEPYARLTSAEILGREVPFIMPWAEGQVMEGVIDVVYRLDGIIRIADYKTDRTTASDARTTAGLYIQQAAVYREAAARCLGLSNVPFECVFLRAGTSVDL